MTDFWWSLRFNSFQRSFGTSWTNSEHSRTISRFRMQCRVLSLQMAEWRIQNIQKSLQNRHGVLSIIYFCQVEWNFPNHFVSPMSNSLFRTCIRHSRNSKLQLRLQCEGLRTGKRWEIFFGKWYVSRLLCTSNNEDLCIDSCPNFLAR